MGIYSHHLFDLISKKQDEETSFLLLFIALVVKNI